MYYFRDKSIFCTGIGNESVKAFCLKHWRKSYSCVGCFIKENFVSLNGRFNVSEIDKASEIKLGKILMLANEEESDVVLS